MPGLRQSECVRCSFAGRTLLHEAIGYHSVASTKSALPSMPRIPSRHNAEIAIIGAGTLATALATAVDKSSCRVVEIVSRDNSESLRRAATLARRFELSATTLSKAKLAAKIIWICVPDDSIAEVAAQIEATHDWRGKIVAHSSGALGSCVLDALKQKGAEIASAHPLMTFVSASASDFTNVPFALEGDPKGLAVIATVVRTLGGKPFRIRANDKPAYHAFGFFSSPAIAAIIAAAQAVGNLAGLNQSRSRELMEPIVRQTINNCFSTSPQEAFSGPLRRGDMATIRRHLRVLEQQPELLQLYRSLAYVAMKHLPVAKIDELKNLLG